MEKTKDRRINLKVILADDDEDDAILFREAMEEISHGINLKIVHDGQALMTELESDVVPDLVFLDLNMPRKNGMECLAEIRRNAAFDRMKIVIYSTSSRKKDVEDTRESGANLYFVKPSSFEALMESLSEILNLNWEEYSYPVSEKKYLFNI